MAKVDEDRERRQKLKEMQNKLEELIEEYQSADNENEVQKLEQEVHKLQCEMQEVSKQRITLESQLREFNYEKKALQNEINSTSRELEQNRNVQKQKLETLKNYLPNGRDAVQAMAWLKDNRDQFHGKIYDPMLIGIDVKDAFNNAKYLENTIPARDLVAFAAETAEDANKLMRQFREVMKLRVNVIQVDRTADPERMRARSGVDSNIPEFKGKSFLLTILTLSNAQRSIKEALLFLLVEPS